ncbi:D-inositol 3-phosphate glycosyltransferase [Microbulbifer aggregans]|uniref:D-inositol 3-phosphate glycosyltransferase n=1 Tax=Microbulbifer aggregans TaxID=1769779 RepID=A0A1C9W9E5_9GAMM|nr:glycosyltransferase family 1 protein [Microbulbifer aggregans]AOS97771.1 D-inositol 3-phosphate glycosyltransferase [Microbulbifer aggregans]
MFKIAIDARPLSSPTAGIGRYTRALVERLVHHDYEWYLYSHRPLVDESGLGSNVSIRTGSVRADSLSTLFAQAVFPVWARKDGIELFWSPRHHLPLLLGGAVAKVLTVHDLVWRHFPETMSRPGLLLERLLMPASIQSASSVIAVSNSTAEELRDAYPQECHKVTTVLEAPFLSPSQATSFGDYFLFLGTLEPRKNLQRLLEGYARYCSRVRAPLTLKICGAKGWGLPELERLLVQLGLEKKVELLGYLSDDALPGLYAGARALLMPSLYEGFGLPIVEAMSQGTPVLASRRGAMMEVAGDGGVLVDPESCEEIASALVTLSEDMSLVETLQEKASIRAGQFSWDNAAEQTLALFESLLSEHVTTTR